MMNMAKRFVKRMGMYEIIAFVSGFILMSYELAASRILAPTIGTSIYVWTSVIGVMIAALAFGYAAGGWVADRRARQQDIVILLFAAAVGITMTCVFYNAVLSTVVLFLSDPRLQGVLAAFLLFAPASFVMGMLSPYLAKLRINSLSTSGRSVAGLGALNSLGGITGTFLTGFVFFNYIGSRETLILLVVLLLACSWAFALRRRSRDRVIVSVVLCAILALQATMPAQADTTVAEIDTPTSHYKVADIIYQDRPLRVLIMGPGGFQSGVYMEGNNELVFNYTRMLANVIHNAPKKDRILILGGGAFTLPEYLGRQYPDSQIDVVEIDPKLPDIAKQYFRYNPTSNITVIAQDARAYLRTTTAEYDVVAVDVYNDESVPFSLATREYAADLKQVVAFDGTVAANIIAATNPSCAPLLSGLHSSYRSAFNQSRVYPIGNPDTARKQNIIAVYSNAPLNWTQPMGGATIDPTPPARPLTDNFAPTERLIQHCQ